MRRAVPLTCLALLAIGHVLLSAWWMHDNGFFSSRPPYQDAAYFRIDSWHMMRAWEESGVVGLLRAARAHDRPHPPLLPMLAAVASLPEGDVTTESQWRVEMLFLALLAVVGYRLSRNFGGPWFAVLATAAMMSAPVIITTARVFYPKLPMTVMILASLDALLRSRAFTRRGWSIAFGALSGIATLTFMLAPLYIVGSALFALIVGLARSGRPRVVIMNMVLASVALLLLLATWYGEHWRGTLAYTRDVTGSSGQVRFSKGLPLWNLERWLFYPKALVNAGLGFFLSSWVVVLALVSAAVRSFRSKRLFGRGDAFGYLPGLTLAVGAVFSFLCVVPGQTAGYAEYVMNVPPLALLFASVVIAAIRLRWLRAVVATLFGATCIVAVYLAYRPLYVDEVGWELGPLHVIDMYDRYGGMNARDQGVKAAPGGEDWHIDEFIDLMIQRSPVGDLRVGQAEYPYLHTYLNTGNLTYAALKRGARLVTVWIPNLDGMDPGEIKRLLDNVDFLIVDVGYARGRDDRGVLEKLLGEVQKTGAKTEIVAHHAVSALSDVWLLQFVRPGEGPLIIPASALEEQGVKQVDVTFENGWHLVGVGVSRVSETSAVIKTLWDRKAEGRPGYEVFVQVADGDQTVASGQRPLVVLPRATTTDGTLAVCSVPVEVPRADPGLKLRLGLRLVGKGQSLDDHSRIVKTNLPAFGLYMVYVAP